MMTDEVKEDLYANVRNRRFPAVKSIWKLGVPFVLVVIMIAFSNVECTFHSTLDLNDADYNPTLPEAALFRLKTTNAQSLTPPVGGSYEQEKTTPRNPVQQQQKQYVQMRNLDASYPKTRKLANLHRNQTRLTADQNTSIHFVEETSTISSKGFMQLPIFGAVKTPAYYYTYVSIGTEASQDFSVIIDTGSDLLVVPCENCNQCGKHNQFIADNSNTAKPESCGNDKACKMARSSCSGSSGTCHFSIHYSEGSGLSGPCYEDQMCLGHWDRCAEKHGGRILYQFGCASTMTNLFVSQAADGIMGVNDNSKGTIVDALAEHHALKKNRFSICLGQEGGFMVVGGVNESLHQLDFVDYLNNEDEGMPSSDPNSNDNNNDNDNSDNNDNNDNEDAGDDSENDDIDERKRRMLHSEEFPTKRSASLWRARQLRRRKSTLLPTLWTKLHRAGSFFGITVEDIAFTTAIGIADMGKNSARAKGVTKSALNEGKGWIVDSGTTYSYLPYEAFRAMREGIEEFCEGGPLRCGASRGFISNFKPKEGALASFTIQGRSKNPNFVKNGKHGDGDKSNKCAAYAEDPSVFASFPIWKILLEGTKAPSNFKTKANTAPVGPWSIEVLPQSYLVLHHESSDCTEATYIIAFYFNPDGGILGANAMTWHDFIFDRTEEQQKLGVAMSSCGYDGALVTPAQLCIAAMCIEAYDWTQMILLILVLFALMSCIAFSVRRCVSKKDGKYNKMNDNNKRLDREPYSDEVPFEDDVFFDDNDLFDDEEDDNDDVSGRRHRLADGTVIAVVTDRRSNLNQRNSFAIDGDSGDMDEIVSEGSPCTKVYGDQYGIGVRGDVSNGSDAKHIDKVESGCDNRRNFAREEENYAFGDDDDYDNDDGTDVDVLRRAKEAMDMA